MRLVEELGRQHRVPEGVEPQPMDCQTFRRLHTSLADDAPRDTEALSVLAHADFCPSCRDLHSALRRGLMIARALQPIGPSAMFRARLRAAIASEMTANKQVRTVRRAVYFAHGTLGVAVSEGRTGERRVRAGVSLSR